MIRVNVAVSIVVGVVAGWIASTMATDPNALSFQLGIANARANNEPAPTVDNSWIAANPILFGTVVALCVFLVGLLVIIASNSKRS